MQPREATAAALGSNAHARGLPNMERAMAAQPKTYLTSEEYLDREQKSDHHSEYYADQYSHSPAEVVRTI